MKQLNKAILSLLTFALLSSGNVFAQCDPGMLHTGKIVRYGEDLQEPDLYGIEANSSLSYNLCRVDFEQGEGFCSLKGVKVSVRENVGSSSTSGDIFDNLDKHVREVRICQRLLDAMSNQTPIQIRIAEVTRDKVLGVSGQTVPVTVLELKELHLLPELSRKNSTGTTTNNRRKRGRR